ncbi:MAG: hypothetical protein Q4P20_11435 [Eubacteriales bacterium]|nr:hypothetical protein [Eubacteriales bacterium]
MKKRVAQILVCVLFLLAIFPTSAHADMGPKPSIQVDFTGMGDEVYYVTLLSKEYSTGPATAYNGNPEYARYHEDSADYAIWENFVNYSDSDGYYFLQQFEKCQGNDHYSWDYFPPSPFKILIYFPESDTFSVSGIYEKYAFDSYFTAAVDASDSSMLTVEKDYPFHWELISLVVRIILTILVELLIALLFGFRAKKQLQIIIYTNVLTQTVLNILLNVVAYRSGSLAFTFYYILGECIVCIIEAVIYARLLPKHSTHAKPIHPILYALLANVLSFSAGMWIARIIPGIF